MNILWLSQLVPYPPKGGVLQRAYHLIHELSRYHVVDLVAFNQQELMAQFYATEQQALDTAGTALRRICRHVEFVPLACDQHCYGKYWLALQSLVTRDPYTINWMKSDLYADKVRQLLANNHYDLVHFDTISLIPYFDHISDAATVLDHHNIESHMLFRRAENERNAFKRWYFKQEGRRLEAVEKRICPQFDLNITCSAIDRDRLVGLTRAPWVEAVPNGVDTSYFLSQGESEQKPSILFVGTLSWYPNIEAVRFIAYQLWPALKASLPGVTVDIVGANPPEDIRQFAQGEAGFTVHGFVDDVRPMFDRAAVYVCPINDGGGTKLKILDALAMQKAIVAHPIACEGINVKHGHDVLFATTAEEYIAHIKALIDDVNLRQQLGRNARQLIEDEYAYHRIGKNMAALYERCQQAFVRTPRRAQQD